MLQTKHSYLEKLAELGYEVVADESFLQLGADEVMARHLPGTSAILSGGFRFTRKHLAMASQLQVIAHLASGYDSLDIPLLTEAGICVTNTPIQAMAEPVADLAFGLVLGLAREIPRYDALLKRGYYERGFGKLVWGKTIGIVGLGMIGKEMVKRARGFNMKVLVCSESADRSFADQWGAVVVSLDTLLEQSDFVSLHLRLTDGNRRLLGRERLSKMKPEAYLINTARMDLLDYDALYDMLTTGAIAGAALDFGGKARDDQRLFRLPNVIATPHLGNRVEESSFAVIECGIANALAVLNGRRPDHLVNPDVWERRNVPAT